MVVKLHHNRIANISSQNCHIYIIPQIQQKGNEKSVNFVNFKGGIN